MTCKVNPALIVILYAGVPFGLALAFVILATRGLTMNGWLALCASLTFAGSVIASCWPRMPVTMWGMELLFGAWLALIAAYQEFMSLRNQRKWVATKLRQISRGASRINSINHQRPGDYENGQAQYPTRSR